MKNILKLAAIIFSTTVVTFAADTLDTPPLAGENNQLPHQQVVSLINPLAQEDLTQTVLRLSALEERLTKHQELDSSPDDLAALKADIRAFNFTETLVQYSLVAKKSYDHVHALLGALTDEKVDFKNSLAKGNLYTEGAMTPIDAFYSHLKALETETDQFIKNVADVSKRTKALKGFFAEKQEATQDPREEILKMAFAALALSEILGGDLDASGVTIMSMRSGSFSQNEECGNCPACLAKKN